MFEPEFTPSNTAQSVAYQFGVYVGLLAQRRNQIDNIRLDELRLLLSEHTLDVKVKFWKSLEESPEKDIYYQTFL